MKNGSRSPWGKVDSVKVVSAGVVFVGTPSHGGYKLDRRSNALIPEAFRRAGGWYEEDVEAHIPEYFLALPMSVEAREKSAKVLKDNWPDAWEATTGEKLTAADSRVVAEREWDAAHANDFVTLAAWGDWHPGVPKGSVGVVASRGGSREPGTEERYVLVAEESYRSPFPGRGYLLTGEEPTWAGPGSKIEGKAA